MLYGILAIGAVVALSGALAWCLSPRLRTAAATELRAVLAFPALNVIALGWKSDETRMQKFLEDISEARDKPAVRFTNQQLHSFTSNFSTCLGSGGCGVVYKGQFPNGVNIAVKVLSTRNVDSNVEKQFMAEVGTIGKTLHTNLVRLYGFCYDHSISALVYEYMENGSLDKYLFCQNQVIEWGKLHDIAVGTAKAIAYLHEECCQRIIHYDIKPANILLDKNLVAKVADFGLAKRCTRDNIKDDSFSEYRGTPGYSAPEFLLKDHPVTYKCDVYSFGMLLFEIVGRRRNAVDHSTDSLDWFPKQVWDEYEQGELAAMIVARGIEEKDVEKAGRMCLVALWCVQDAPEARPPMSAVVKMLKEEEVEIVPPPKPFRYLYSVRMDVLNKSANKTATSNSSSTCRGSNLCLWFEESSHPVTD